MNCKYDIKDFSVIIVFFLATFTCYADIHPYFDYGELEMNFLIEKDTKVNAGIECFDFMFIEGKTGLYGALCPIKLEFKDIDKENEMQKNPADVCYFTLINANVGWIKALNDYFFFELFVNCNTLDPFKINYTTFRGGVEFSYVPNALRSVGGVFSCIGKVYSCEIGVCLSSMSWREPVFYFAIDFNFAALAMLPSCCW